MRWRRRRALAWLAMVAVAVIVAASILRRKIAWRSWAILASWVLAADMLPVIVGRLNYLPAVTFGLETRYVADAAPVLAICLALAFLRSAERRAARPVTSRRNLLAMRPTGPGRRSIRGVRLRVDLVSPGLSECHYWKRGKALCLERRAGREAGAPRHPRSGLAGTGGDRQPSVRQVWTGVRRGRGHARGKQAGKLHWITHPVGTVDGLEIFGTDGRLYPAKVFGVRTPAPTANQGCWPTRHGRIVVRFAAPASIYAWELRIGYIWGSPYPGLVAVHYGRSMQVLHVAHGLHSAFLPISGSADAVVVTGLGGRVMCVGDVEAGALGPDPRGPAIPPR